MGGCGCLTLAGARCPSARVGQSHRPVPCYLHRIDCGPQNGARHQSGAAQLTCEYRIPGQIARGHSSGDRARTVHVLARVVQGCRTDRSPPVRRRASS